MTKFAAHLRIDKPGRFAILNLPSLDFPKKNYFLEEGVSFKGFDKAGLFLAKLAGLISLALILAYALKTEYHHLFH